MLTVNDRSYPFCEGMRLADLARVMKPGADMLILNGAPAPGDSLLKDGDICSLIKTGEIPSALDMDHSLAARHSRKFQHRFKRATIGIMGLGGLGSAVALSLVRIGIGRLIISDYDVVVLSNIHCQQYYIDQIGLKKTVALKKNLVRVNPFVAITTLDVKLGEQSIPQLFQGVNVLVECFADPVMKRGALKAVQQHMPGTGYVGSSTMAGSSSGNTVFCRRIQPHVYIVEDNEPDPEKSAVLFAPRIGIAAQHQAHQVVRLLLDINDK